MAIQKPLVLINGECQEIPSTDNLSNVSWGFINGIITAQTDLTTYINSFGFLTTSLAASTYEPIITVSTSTKYWRGDKTFQTLDTLAVTENTNLYFTNARSIASTLTAYSSGSGTITSSDTILSAIQKLNGNIALSAVDTNVVHITGTETITGLKTFTDIVGAASGSLASSLLTLNQTWNTTGNPTAILLNVTNTASGSTSKLMDLQVGSVSKFNISTLGQVGIGIVSQGELLHIHNINTSGPAAIQFSNPASSGISNGFHIGIAADASGLINHKQATYIAFGTNNLERFRVDFNGNVGIGTGSTVPDILTVVKNTTTVSEGTFGISLRLTATGTPTQLSFATLATYSVIQSFQSSASWAGRPLVLQPNGGYVNIGSVVSSTHLLNVIDTVLANSGSLFGSVLNLAQTWNTSGAPSAIKLNVTNTASNAGSSMLLDLQVGGVTQFAVRTNGQFYFGSPASTTNSIAANGVGQFFRSNNVSTAQYGFTFRSGQVSQISTVSGVTGLIELGEGFAPTSGTGVYNVLNYDGVINQTGGASGITRGIYIAPTITAASDWRAIEVTVGKTLFNTTSGSMGIGVNTTPAASAILDITSTTQGMLKPRMTTTQVTAIATPAEGLELYDLTTHTPKYYNGTTWVSTGVIASPYTPAVGTVTVGDTIQQAIQKLDGNYSQLVVQIGTVQVANNLFLYYNFK